MTLRETIERLYEATPGEVDRKKCLRAVGELKFALNCGEVRAAVSNKGKWCVNRWVKKGLLLAFRVGNLADFSTGTFRFFDKETMGIRKFALRDGVRIVPGGSIVRDGAYIAKGAVLMPPSYVNIGAYVDSGTMIDSHALVGSCAQIGKKVHCSAAAQIGGVLEPVGAMPVIIEDEVFIGGNSGIYEGTIVKRRAVIGAGVILTKSTPVYDLVKRKIYRYSAGAPLIIPENAVVVAGSRQIRQTFAREHRLSLYTPVIIKYRDEKTDSSTALEKSLR